jgi:hypothetical protein
MMIVETFPLKEGAMALLPAVFALWMGALAAMWAQQKGSAAGSGLFTRIPATAAAVPRSGAFCAPGGGPQQMVGVEAEAPIKHGLEPILPCGELAARKRGPQRFYDRLSDAVATVAKIFPL